MRAMVVLVLAVFLAGCSDGSSPGDVNVQATKETGVIRGVVLDTTITPVPGANISIEGFTIQAVTNADGAFGFDGLEPGRYVLRASKAGFSPLNLVVDVVAGVDAPEFVQLRLQQLLVSQPFVQPHQWDGFLQCSYRIVRVADNCPDGEAEVTHAVPSVPDWVQSELTWQSTQLLGDELSFQYSIPNTFVDYVEIEGPSPLQLVADPALIDKAGIGDGLDIYMRIFTADLQETRPPTGDWGVGVQIDQAFTVYTHIFYDAMPEPGWTFLADGAPNV